MPAGSSWCQSKQICARWIFQLYDHNFGSLWSGICEALSNLWLESGAIWVECFLSQTDNKIPTFSFRQGQYHRYHKISNEDNHPQKIWKGRQCIKINATFKSREQEFGPLACDWTWREKNYNIKMVNRTGERSLLVWENNECLFCSKAAPPRPPCVITSGGLMFSLWHLRIT